jgi:dTDP-4-amino-4,6-dideoxygalactose transaminase
MENSLATTFAHLHRAAHGVCVSSGTAALQTALEAAVIGGGDEVIVPAVTWIATASAVLAVNAVPVFVDIDPDTFCISPAAAAAAVTERTRAIIPVHLSGAMADLDAIDSLARRHGLQVIEDAAHAHGSLWRCPDGVVRGPGAVGLAGCFSLQASKAFTAGEGGIVLTNDEAFADRCWSYRNVGRPRRDGQEAMLGNNFRLSEVQAAVALAGLETLEQEVETRDANAQFLNRRLRELPGIRPARRDGRVVRQGYYGYILAYEPAAWDGVPRARFVKALRAEGIQASEGWRGGTVYGMEFWRVRKERFPFAARYDPSAPDYQRPHCPIAEQFTAEREVTLPHPMLLASRDDAEDIVRAVEKLHAHRQELLQQPAVAIV